MVAFRFDGHQHSSFEEARYTSICTPKNKFRRALDIGLDGFAVTDARMDVFYDSVLKSPKKHLPSGCELYALGKGCFVVENREGKKVFVFRGMEFHDNKGHLLVIGNEEKAIYKENTSLIERARYAHDIGGTLVIAHTFHSDFGGVSQEDFDMLCSSEETDCVEIFNPLSNVEFNERARKGSEKYGLPGLSQSDCHDTQVGRAHTTLDFKIDNLSNVRGELNDSLKSGRIIGHHQEYKPLLSMVWTFGAMRILTGEPRDVINNAIYFIKNKGKR